MKPHTSRWTLPLIASIALTACGGGGGGTGSLQPTGNLTATGMRVTSSDPNAAHEIEIETAIASTAEFKNVQIEYYALSKEDVDTGVEEPRQWELGSFRYETVPPGTSAHPATLVLPTDVERGDYYVISRVDPLDEIMETNEEDNLPGEDAEDVVITISTSRLGWHDIVLESLTPDTDVVVLTNDEVTYQVASEPNVANHHLGVTVEMTTSGRDPVANVDLSARFRLSDGGYRTLSVWDENSTSYDSRYWIDAIEPGIPNTIHLDLHIPSSTREVLRAQLASNGGDMVDLEVRSNVAANINEWEAGSNRHADRPDNTITVPIRIVDVLEDDAPESLEFELDFNKDWSNGVFGVGLDVAAYSYLDDRGAIGSFDAEVPVRLFRSSAKVIDFEAYGQVTPQDTTQSRFDMSIKSFGATLFSVAETSPSYTYDNVWSVRREREVKSLLWVGPVPIEVTAGAGGTIGYETSLRITPASIDLTSGPFAEVDAFAQAKINLGVASGGVRGDLTLLREDLMAHTAANLSLANGGTELRGDLTQELTHTLTGPNGRLYLFVNYPGVKLCKTIIGSVPCGVRTIRKEKTLVRFATFQKRDTLFANTQFSVVPLVSN